jgi:hypothetical protein
MTKRSNHLISKVFIGCLMLAVVTFSSFARINSNGAGQGYDGGGENVDDRGDTIENYIIQGGGYYLGAHADIQALLRLVELEELQGLDFNRLNTLVDSAAANMENAVKIYEKLIKKAEVTPYNQSVQALLRDFDYDGFMNENGLNPFVFAEVKGFLEAGDITGVFKKTCSDFITISGLLNSIKAETSLDKLPDIPVLRRLNEICSENSLFGSYAAGIFSALF